ncbi:hypothetical protein GO986_08035 [Deinococcus sp. HMF7620]|uniref:Uncharacterized protein n=1 Tax=Deinococcus arboris TaxID=2682977 RepID=A0A7C9I2P9_9DEIO|nr:hypothetical protein [Deinococcus arboris]MVN86711.1 hypothetical protein [Deinococcus arboris]
MKSSPARRGLFLSWMPEAGRHTPFNPHSIPAPGPRVPTLGTRMNSGWRRVSWAA